MAELFTSILKARPPNPNQKYICDVICVFSHPEHPGEGMEANLGSFKDPELAAGYAAKMASECKHEFLTFVVRPKFQFFSFGQTATDSKLVVLSEDDKVNQQVLAQHNADLKAKEQKSKRDKLLEIQMKEEEIDGTPANIGRLIYLCQQADSNASHHFEQSQTFMVAYNKHLRNLIGTLKKVNPSKMLNWRGYMKTVLTDIGDKHIFEMIDAWWEKNKDRITEQLSTKDDLKLPIPSS